MTILSFDDARNSVLQMQREMQQEIAKSHYRFGDAIDIMRAFTEQPEDLDFVLPGLIAGTVGALVSPGGTGKSMMALQIAVQIAGGPNLLNMGSLKLGKVTYFAAEDPSPAILQRLFHMGSHLDNDNRERVAKNLTVRSLVGKNPDLLNKDWIEHIASFASENRLIILDTLRRFHQLDENSSSDMNSVLNSLDAISAESGCSILFLHHANKGAVYSGQGDMQQASRGSSVLVDNIRWQANLCSMTREEAKEWGVADDARGSFLRFNISKRNYVAPEGDKWLRRWEGGILKPAVLERKSQTRGGVRHYE